ncbi:MAG: hypothetical protein U0491_03570 [Candidatus Saccharimonadales bacterium]
MATKKSVWKKPTKKDAKKQPERSEQSLKVVKLRTLLKQSWLELSTFWRQLLGITAVYAFLYFVFVMGLSITASFQNTIDTTASRFVQASSAFGDALANLYGGTQSDATVLVQVLLFLMASLAIIWALRKLQALKKITIRDAYYQGNAQLLPVLLVSIMLVLTLLPAVLGSGLLSIALQAGGTGVEIILIGAISLLLLFCSAFLFTMLWPSFYIASLPKMRPIQSVRSAMVLTKKRRLAIMRKLLFLVLISLLFLFVVMIPLALIAPVSAPYVAFAVLFLIFLYGQIYLYELYRSLLP